MSLNGWQSLDFGKVDFKANLANGVYDTGIAVRTGKTISGKYYLVVLDFDGREAVNAWFESWENVLALSKKTLVEWHQDEGKIHIFVFSPEPLPSRRIHIKDSYLEIRCQNEGGAGQLVFVSPSIHKEGNPYTALGCDKIEVMQPIDLLRIKEKIGSLCDDYMSDADRDKYEAMLHDQGLILGENCGRHDATKFIVICYYFKYSDEWLDLTDEQRFERAWQWHLTHCNPPRPRQEFNSICKWVVKTLRRKRDEFHAPKREERDRIRQQSTEHYGQHNENKTGILDRIEATNSLGLEIKKILDADIWTQTSENPLKFIVARSKACHICRCSITYSDSGKGEVGKTAHINYGSILIRLYPKRITLHESPLKFLEAPPQYTLVFENQNRQDVRVSGTIESIVSKLREMPGYVV